MSDYKYTPTGTKVQVECVLNEHEYLVRSILMFPEIYGDEEVLTETLGELQIVNKLFDNPPTEVIAQEIVAMQSQVAVLAKTIKDYRDELAKEQREYEQRKKKLTDIPELRQLEAFMAGKITHYVNMNKYSAPTIIEFKDTKSEYGEERGLGKMRLLTLFGKSNGNLEWQLNTYHDGSGSDYTVIPCFSLEEAQTVLQQEFEKRFKTSSTENLLTEAQKAGITIPIEFVKRVKQFKLDYAQREIERIEKEVEKAKEALNKLLSVQ